MNFRSFEGSVFLMYYFSIIISGLALLLTLGQIIFAAIKKRTKIDITIESIQQYNRPDKKIFILLCTLINLSDSPINITRITFFTKGNIEVKCDLCEKLIGERHYSKYPETDISTTKRVYSTRFPISLPAHGATMQHIHFSLKGNIQDFCEGEDIQLKITTDKKTLDKTCKCIIHKGRDAMEFI